MDWDGICVAALSDGGNSVKAEVSHHHSDGWLTSKVRKVKIDCACEPSYPKTGDGPPGTV